MTTAPKTLNYGERGTVVVYDDAEALAVAAADMFTRTATTGANAGGATIALSGGSTPKRMCELLAAAPYRERVPWSSLQLFWGDERWVPESSPESNAGEAKRLLLDQVPIPPDHVHPFPTVDMTPEAAADTYEATIREIVSPGENPPVFDLIFLGMGDDGHTASLFPRTAAIHERAKLVVAHFVPKLDATRLTLTPPILNAAKRVAFLIAGGGKAETLSRVLDGPEEPDVLPSQIIRPPADRLFWLVDRAAASQLRGGRDTGHG